MPARSVAVTADRHQPLPDWRLGVDQRHAPAVDLEARLRIGRPYLAEHGEEEFPELPDAGIVLAELLVQRHPGDELLSALRDAVQPLGQPAVDVERQRR